MVLGGRLACAATWVSAGPVQSRGWLGTGTLSTEAVNNTITGKQTVLRVRWRRHVNWHVFRFALTASRQCTVQVSPLLVLQCRSRRTEVQGPVARCRAHHLVLLCGMERAKDASAFYHIQHHAQPLQSTDADQNWHIGSVYGVAGEDGPAAATGYLHIRPGKCSQGLPAAKLVGWPILSRHRNRSSNQGPSPPFR